MKKLIQYILISLVLFSACENGFLNSGEITTKTVELQPFYYMEINDVFDIELRSSNRYQVSIAYGAQLIDNISLEIENDTLKLINTSDKRWSREYTRPKLILEVDSLYKITMFEPSHLYTEQAFNEEVLIIWAIADLCEIDMEINCRSFYFVNAATSSGLYTFSGTITGSSLWVRGSGVLNAENLETGTAWVRQESVADVRVWSYNSLEYEMLSPGNIYYRGNPVIKELKRTSSGNVLPIH